MCGQLSRHKLGKFDSRVYKDEIPMLQPEAMIWMRVQRRLYTGQEKFATMGFSFEDLRNNNKVTDANFRNKLVGDMFCPWTTGISTISGAATLQY